MEKENQRIMLTKRLLKEALLTLMAEKNIQQISVSELCQTAGINRSTFYNHYGSQFDVLKELEHDTANKIKEVLDKKNPDKSISKKVETMCTFLLENKAVSKVLFRNNTADDKFAEFLFTIPQMCDSYNMISDRHDDVTKDLIMTFLTNGSYSLIRKWLLDDCPKTPKEIGELAYIVATQGWTS